MAQLAVAPQEAGPKLVAYRTHPRFSMSLAVAPARRQWMDETAGQFAYRCLPLLIANQCGWFVLNSHEIRVTWDGNAATHGIRIDSAELPFLSPASSHFGHGIVTFTLPYLFRTPPGYNLLVRGPVNCPKDGAYPLEGVIETDWSVASFTMNWKLMRPGMTITFAKDEPLCMIVPQRRGEAESFYPEVRRLDENPELALHFRDWSAGRRGFLEALNDPAPGRKWADTWQKHYFEGMTPDGVKSEGHQTRLKLRSFSTDHLTKEAEMPFEPLTSNDLSLMNRLVQSQPDLQDTITILRRVSTSAKYPIANFDALASALGGDNATITFRGRTMTMAEARSAIPTYYFPIVSDSDLTTKVGDLEQALPKMPVAKPVVSAIKWAQEIPKTPGRALPTLPPRPAPPGGPKASGVK